jgi:hypothetical protein
MGHTKGGGERQREVRGTADGVGKVEEEEEEEEEEKE